MRSSSASVRMRVRACQRQSFHCGGLDLRVEALAEGARERADREALHAHHHGSPAAGAPANAVDGRMWFGEKLRCRRWATGWLFSLDLKQLHGITSPPCFRRTGPSDNRRLLVRQKRELFQRHRQLISSGNASRHNFFRGPGRRTTAGRPLRPTSLQDRDEEAVGAVGTRRHQQRLGRAVGGRRRCTRQGLRPELRPRDEPEVRDGGRGRHRPDRGSPAAAPSR